MVSPDYFFSVLSHCNSTNEPGKHVTSQLIFNDVIFDLSQLHCHVKHKTLSIFTGQSIFWYVHLHISFSWATLHRLPVQVSFWLLALHHSLQGLQLGHRLTHCRLCHRVVSLGTQTTQECSKQTRQRDYRNNKHAYIFIEQLVKPGNSSGGENQDGAAWLLTWLKSREHPPRLSGPCWFYDHHYRKS